MGAAAPGVTKPLPFTEASLVRAIKGVERAGRFVIGVRLADGTLIVGDKPLATASLVPQDAQPSPAVRRFGEKINGSHGAA
jgi:hypothetical protein